MVEKNWKYLHHSLPPRSAYFVAGVVACSVCICAIRQRPGCKRIQKPTRVSLRPCEDEMFQSVRKPFVVAADGWHDDAGAADWSWQGHKNNAEPGIPEAVNLHGFAVQNTRLGLANEVILHSVLYLELE